ncbi:Glycosyl transferase, family 25 [Litoreibacter arenae DSM 19593]|uniref:Glycosyl transferase, family 25 n=2 Tax=Litoreibacter TaxID=947567 RepID=S9QJU2_9RHOB|nr:Glycosyl transferase, family 25 [Litoreibacter arenae DSM 19593]
MLADDLDHIVVLEDDVFVSEELGAAVEDIISHSPKDFDVVKLDGVPQVCLYGKIMPVGGGRHLREVLQVSASAACYLVSRRGAERLVVESEQFCDHLDDFIFNPASGRTILQLDPAVAVQAIWSEQPNIETIGETVKTSERTQDPKINPQKSKGPVLYRLLKDLKRNARKLSRKLYRDRALLASGGLIGTPRLAADLGQYKKPF